MYYRLFNHVTDAIEILRDAQLEAEDAFLEDDEELIILSSDQDEAER